MHPHFTPIALAEYLASHVPVTASNVLEPSAGHGDLISPLLAKLPSGTTYTCLDKNANSLDFLCRRHASVLGKRLIALRTDFLTWTDPKHEKAFDCIVMNPPFSGKRKTWKSLTFLNDKHCAQRKAPLEAVFLMKALLHLAPGGTIVAILPSSLVAGSSLNWIRQELATQGTIRLVHELPPFTFSNIEAQFFVLVYQDGSARTKTILLNHELAHPQSRRLLTGIQNPELRLDFAFTDASRRLHSLVSRTSQLAWTSLDNLATVTRGDVSAPFQKRKPLHTSDCGNGFWAIQAKNTNELPLSNPSARSGDILIARVGRNALKSTGLLTGHGATKFSACVLRVRPKRNVSRLYLLLTLRAIYADSMLSKLMERGTGANYITAHGLRQCLLPSVLPVSGLEVLGQYCYAIKRRNIQRMMELEGKFAQMLGMRE